MEPLHNCQSHPGQECMFFCKEHDVPICAKCITSTHKQHDVLDFEEAKPNLINRVSSEIDQRKQKQKEIRQKKTFMKTLEQKLD